MVTGVSEGQGKYVEYMTCSLLSGQKLSYLTIQAHS